MNKTIAVLILICSASYAQDGQIAVDAGLGVFNSGKKSLSETKMVSISSQEDLWGALKQRATVGGWFDNTGSGRSSSGLISGQLGFEVNRNNTIVGIFSGPTVLSNTDVLLGGNFQFMDDLRIGIQDNKNNYIGLFYRHISSAGIEMPNIGRDLVGLEIRF